MHNVIEYILSVLKQVMLSGRKEHFEDKQFLLSLADHDDIPLPVACAFLLTDMAQIDGSFDGSEHAFFLEKLGATFSLSRAGISNLALQTQTMLATARGASSYAEYVKCHFTLEQRKQMLELVRGMMDADSVEDGRELYLIQHFADALGLT